MRSGLIAIIKVFGQTIDAQLNVIKRRFEVSEMGDAWQHRGCIPVSQAKLLIGQRESQLDEAKKEINGLLTLNGHIAMENTRLRAALEWYADEKNWENGMPGVAKVICSQTTYYPDEKTWLSDKGHRAKSALSKTEGRDE